MVGEGEVVDPVVEMGEGGDEGVVLWEGFVRWRARGWWQDSLLMHALLCNTHIHRAPMGWSPY